ncbi:MAG: glycosyltransferase [Cyclobacteriaceae bacterium]
MILLPSLAGGGAERTILNLANNIDESRFHLKILLLTAEGPYLENIDQSKLLFQTKTLFQKNGFIQFFQTVFRILPFQIKTIKRERPDIIMTVTESMNYYGFFLRKWMGSSAFQWIVRCGNNIFLEAASKQFPANWVLQKLLKLTYRSADKIVTINKGINPVISNRYGIEKQKIVTIYNPLDLDLIKRMSKAPCPSNLPDNFILGVGRLEKQKRFDVLIKAFAKSALVDEGTHLVIIGKGSKLRDLIQLAESLGVSDFVHFEGFQSNPYAYMRATKAFVLTSDWEGFAHVVAEALACEARVISSDCDFGPKEILKQGELGALFSCGNDDELAVLFKKEIAREVNPKSIEKPNRFDLKRIISNYESLLESM